MESLFLKPYDGPVVKELEWRETVYAKDQPEYIPLRALRTHDGRVLTRWSLDAEQRKAVAEGADIFLELSTFNHPLQPIRMALVVPDEFIYGVGDIEYNWKQCAEKIKDAMKSQKEGK